MNGVQQRKGIEMNGIQHKKGQNIEKFPGCLGRMVNLFDLNSGVPGNRLLTDKPHRDGSSLSRSQSDVVRMPSPTFGDQIEDKVIVSELRTFSNKKGNVTPMKMLLAQEMSKDVESKCNPPNVVAKLMGLDALPRQQHNSSAQRCRFKGSSRHSSCHSEIPVESWEQDQSFPDEQMQCEVSPCEVPNKYKDVYEIWQQSPRTTYSRDSSPQKGRYSDNANENKMALVRQKFMEAKHLVTDEKLRQSKEFQDALEVLSSNRELFLKFLEEPNSTFSQHLNNFRCSSLPPQTKRITVLRPSKMVDNEKFVGTGQKGDNQTKKPVQIGQVTGYGRNNNACSPFPSPKVEEYPSQPTRIVVLKPSPGKNQDIIRTPASPSPPLPRILHGGDFYEEPEEDDARESKEVAKEITRHMRENLMGHRRDETLLSSVFSNGYTGDDSSCNRSENEYPVENLSDSEVMSPTSRHSWDYINRFASPYSSSPFSRVSCSPESSVCREAKKRLSERWAMMTSNGSSQEQRHGRRSSSTLGEMLALSDTKKLVRSEEEGSSKEQERRGSTSCVASNSYEEESTSGSPKNIMRSKSVPGSSTMYGVRLDNEISDPEASKEQVPKELMKTKSMKSSLKGKVSSLFFSKNKKTNKEKYSGSQSTDESPSVTPGTPGSPIIHPRKISNDASQCVNGSYIQECLSPVVGGSASKTPLPDLIGIGQKQGMITTEGGLSVANPSMPVPISENQEQPSPISVLEPPFEEDENMISESSGGTKPVHRGVGVPPRSNLIDKSPPIESIARTLSWDDSCSETATLLYPSKLSSVSPGAKEEEQDWFFFVQLLLSAAGLNGEVQLDSFFARWHSAESPLEPCLRDKYANLNDKEPLHEAKRRQWRSNRKLIFDCVNAALLEISGYGSDRCMKAMSFGRAQMIGKEGASPMLVDHVWAQMKEWFSGEVKCLGCDDGDSDSLVVERVVQKEVVGKGWIDQMKWEADNLGREIEWRLLEELVEEAVTDLTGKLF
ncbi:Methyl-coenzyme M reductase II subunit gamma [Gossypium australe]|uniref:Methyl-coenzyme M reductase II subunit gamma n=1 Tax=Gossypium australe TaxID=47621 RepID=A0A5B6URT7_9ROSI|nr:Methyl-coenzyme M reductase II subunit gamma [Gossypium australe]